MRLEPLEFVERTEIRVLVIEADHKADSHLVVLEMIQERSAISAAIHRPADRMGHMARLVVLWFYFPKFLDAYTVGLVAGFIAQIEFLEQRLGQRPAAPFREDGLFGVQFEPGLIITRLFAVLADTHVTGRDATDLAVFIVKYFRGGKPRINFDAHRLGLFGQPAAHIAEADDVIAVIVHLRRRRQFHRARLTEQQELIAFHRCVERRTPFLPVGEQLGERARFQNRTGQDMCADLGAFFDDTDRNFAAFFLGQLTQADCRRQPRRPGADDHHVEFHRFTFYRFSHVVAP